MGYKDNQRSDRIQRSDGDYRKITGLWKKVVQRIGKKDRTIYKSGLINVRGWENMQAFGDRTIFLVVPNKINRKHGSPDMWLVAVEEGSYKRKKSQTSMLLSSNIS